MTTNTNLRESKRQSSALRKAAAPKAAAARKAAPAKRTPANKAAAPKKATLRWELLAPREPGRSAVPQVGTCDGHAYRITGAAKAWTVTHVAPDGTEAVLTPEPVGYAAAYAVVTKANAARKGA
jgi:hypothetical protein